MLQRQKYQHFFLCSLQRNERVPLACVNSLNLAQLFTTSFFSISLSSPCPFCALYENVRLSHDLSPLCRAKPLVLSVSLRHLPISAHRLRPSARARMAYAHKNRPCIKPSCILACSTSEHFRRGLPTSFSRRFFSAKSIRVARQRRAVPSRGEKRTGEQET